MLLLDEPTSALDSDNLQRVVALLKQARSAGTTIVGVFHDTNVVRELAGMVIKLDRGTVQSIST
jgi:alpha-D-ribose 1-methylphosphonate 5-triphosphate synthase subunit PhnL